MTTAQALYDPAVALAFFRSAGKAERYAPGATIFAENARARSLLMQRDRMYYVYDGEVSLVAKSKVIGRVLEGEVFGELAPLTRAPRSAAAVAKTACRVISLDDEEFRTALMKRPAFALMLMSVMVTRLRQTIGALRDAGVLSVSGAWKEAAVFDRRQLADLVQGLANDPQIYYERGAMVIKEGAMGARMYTVLDGRVAVTIAGSMVERVGPGGVFGEAALVDQSTRMASVQAETDCTLQPVGRTAFLELVKVSPVFAERMLSALAQRLRLLTARLD
jgi:CRP/FNR family transcriptional regulator, cyclic AMP receptor protein